MRWIALAKRDTATATLKKRLRVTADRFPANSGLKPQEYSRPILGLVFLRIGDRLRRRPPHGYDLCSVGVCP